MLFKYLINFKNTVQMRGNEKWKHRPYAEFNTVHFCEATDATASAVKCKNGITEPQSTEMYFGKITIAEQTVCTMHGFV